MARSQEDDGEEAGRISTYRVSKRGQFCLPARARKRWGLEDGGEVEVVDLGDCVVMYPGGPGTLRQSVWGAVSDEELADFIANIDDPDLRNE
jgi:bifunctional DNA-binding transcriptional regulator/antitoxin component of YhaV-PrlF toxin-antitoxin module